LPLIAPLSLAPYTIAVRVWTAILIVALGTVIAGSLRLAGTAISRANAVGAAALVVAFAPATSDLALGQIAIVAVAGLVVAAIAFESTIGEIGGAAGTIIAALQPNLALPLVTLFGRRAHALTVLGGLALFTGLCVAIVKPAGIVHYLNVLGFHMEAEANSAIQLTVAATAAGFGVPANVAGTIALTLALLIVLISTYTLWNSRYDAAGRVALGCAGLPLVIGFAHEHDLAVTLPAAIVALRRSTGRAAYFAAAGAMLVAIDWLGLAQRPYALGQTIILAEAAALSFGCLAIEAGGPLRATMIGIALAVLPIGWIAGHWPVPIWPDALPAGFHISHGAGIARAWWEQQNAVGLFRIAPSWAMLRALSLTGCALLWLALLPPPASAAQPANEPV
jgi:hypothetical protein